jgi:hypothetical protein
MAALLKAKLIARGEIDDTHAIVFAVTPMGRKFSSRQSTTGPAAEKQAGETAPKEETGEKPKEAGPGKEGEVPPKADTVTPSHGDIKAEEVNPNVRHIDPELLKSREMRGIEDQGERTPVEMPKPAEAPKAQQLKKRPKSRWGFEQAKKPDQEEEKKDQ